MSRGKRNTSDQWDVKGHDVPGGRLTRSLVKGLAGLDDEARMTAKTQRRRALNRIRRYARNVEDPLDREALWALIPVIGYKGYPAWDEVVAGVQVMDLLDLARRGEHHIEMDARRDRDAQMSERRTCMHSVDEYLRWQEKEEFAPETVATAASALRRLLAVQDPVGERYAVRRIATLVRSDGRRILDHLADSGRTGQRVDKKTYGKNRKVLKAWFNWELQREKERAEERRRQPLYSMAIFDPEKVGYSTPTKDATATVDDRDSRRFYPEQMDALYAAASETWQVILTVMRCLGLRPGEFIHIRWLDDVRPLPNGNGYEIRLEGGRGLDSRCGCRQCRSRKGWAPKNGPRRYILDRRYDEVGWLAPAIAKLDAWVRMRKPARGDYLFPDPDDHSRPWTSNKLNKALHALGKAAGVTTGRARPGSRTFHSLRHTCASELLEIGVDHAHAAWWIGDSLREFQKTYGRPTDEAMAHSIFAPITTRNERLGGKESK